MPDQCSTHFVADARVGPALAGILAPSPQVSGIPTMPDV